jgi:long-chain acyl-CoA synthetase
MAAGDDPSAWYARRPWTVHYPDSMPRDVDIEPGSTMLSLLQDACAQHADGVAFELDGEPLTFREWLRRSDALARFFVHEWQLETGDRVLVMLPNLPAFPIALLAAWIAGLAIMPVYVAAATQELEGPIAAIAPKAIVGLDVLMPTVRAARGADAMRELVVSAAPEYFGTAAPGPAHAVAFEEAIRRGAALAAVQRIVRPDDLALMSYTGGTTGVSKAVRTTHANMRAGIEILRITMAEHTCGAGGLVVSVHPFSHAAGMSVNLLQYSSRGVTQLLFPKMIDAERVGRGCLGRHNNEDVA